MDITTALNDNMGNGTVITSDFLEINDDECQITLHKIKHLQNCTLENRLVVQNISRFY